MSNPIESVDIVFDGYKPGLDDFRVLAILQSTRAKGARIWNQGAEPWVSGAEPVGQAGVPRAPKNREGVAVFADAPDVDSGVEWVADQCLARPSGDWGSYGALINSGIAMARVGGDRNFVEEAARESWSESAVALSNRVDSTPEGAAVRAALDAHLAAQRAYQKAREANAAREFAEVAALGGDALKSCVFFSSLATWAARAEEAGSVGGGDKVAKGLERAGFASIERSGAPIDPGTDEAARFLCGQALESIGKGVAPYYGLVTALTRHVEAMGSPGAAVAGKLAARRSAQTGQELGAGQKLG